MGPTCGFGQLRYYAKSFLVIAMPTIIEQIQLDALSKSVSVSDLLRRVKLAAVKLGLGQIEDWVERELNGYKTEVPDYRVVHGVPMAKHPYADGSRSVARWKGYLRVRSGNRLLRSKH
jgi:AbiTii